MKLRFNSLNILLQQLSNYILIAPHFTYVGEMEARVNLDHNGKSTQHI